MRRHLAPVGTSWHLQAHQHCHRMEAPMTPPSTGQSIKSTHIATQSSSTLPSHGRHHPRLQHHAPDGSFKIRDGKPPFLKHLGTLDLGTHYTLVHPSTLLGATTTPCTHENMPDHDIQISSTFPAACIIIITVLTGDITNHHPIGLNLDRLLLTLSHDITDMLHLTSHEHAKDIFFLSTQL